MEWQVGEGCYPQPWVKYPMKEQSSPELKEVILIGKMSVIWQSLQEAPVACSELDT